MLDAGASRSEITARLLALREQVRLVFVLETLEYLQRGGRIGKAQAFVGTLLKFKPLLGIVDGEVVPLARVRSRGKALDTAQELLTQQVSGRGARVRMALTNALAPEETWAAGARLSKLFETSDFYVSDLGPVIGVHVGPGTIGVAVMPTA
jgi:DegV family protein with EDD domain